MKVIKFIQLSSTIIFYLMIHACSQDKKGAALNAPLFEKIGNVSFNISTNSKMAQRFFNQGLALSYGLNHSEAFRSFEEASKLDPECAMCYWGMGYVLGRNINSDMDTSILNDANNAITSAIGLMNKASEKEKSMIWALSKRYPKQAHQDLTEYNFEYANAMKQVHNQFKKDNNIATLYAEALMNTHPWDYWENDGKQKPWTGKILSVLEAVLSNDPNHIGSNHLYIHAVEASKKPDMGSKSAKILSEIDMELGHLVHMPSHIFIRIGLYHEGSLVNEKAAKYDSTYIAACNAQGVYPLAYFPHNYHFLAATATLEGRGEVAINAAFQVAANANAKLMREPEWSTLQHYYSIPYFVLVKFAQWDQILTIPQPEKDLKYPNAIWQYARGMAFLGKGQQDNAQKSLNALKNYVQDSSLKKVKIWETNSVSQIINIASLVLEAELYGRNQQHVKSIKLLYEALEIEDNLVYQEPPDWFFSVRHSLGFMLLENGQIEESLKVYSEDLELYPNNGWALRGMMNCHLQNGDLDLALDTRTKFEEAWKFADVGISSSKVLTENTKQYKNLNDSYLFSKANNYVASIATCRRN